MGLISASFSDAFDDFVLARAGVGGEQRHDLVQLAVGQELVQRRVEETDRHRDSRPSPRKMPAKSSR
jgi:hypothetical protein